MPVISELISRFSADTASFDAGVQRVSKGLASVDDQASKASRSARQMAEALAISTKGITLAGDEATKADKRVSSLADEVARLSKAFKDVKAPELKVSGHAEESKKGGGSKSDDKIKNLKETGEAIQKAISEPLLNASKSAINLSADFEASMTKIQATTGASKSQTDAWAASIVKLGPTLGKSPKELADALLYVSRAGYKGSEAMDVLTRAGKLSAVGLGDTTEDAKGLVSVMQAYASSHLTAAQAADTLYAATKVGDIDMAALESSLEKVNTTAGSMGIPFQQVAGTLAVFHKAGFDAGEAMKGVQGILEDLESPSKETTERFAALAKSTHDSSLNATALRSELASNLFGALVHLSSATKGNREAFEKLFPNVKDFGSMLEAVTRNLKTSRAEIDEVVDASGRLDQGLNQTTSNTKFKMQQLSASIDSLKISVGAALAPTVRFLADQVKVIVDVFSQLPQPVQATLGIIALLGATVGPVILQIANLAKVTSAVRMAMTATQGAMTAASVAAGGLAAAEGAEAAAAGTAAAATTTLDLALLPLIAGFAAVSLAVYGVVKAYQSYMDVSVKTNEEIDQEGQTELKALQQKAQHARQVYKLYTEIEKLGSKTNRTAKESHDLHEKMNELSQLNPDFIKGYNGQGDAIKYVSDQSAILTTNLNLAEEAARKLAFAIEHMPSYGQQDVETTDSLGRSQVGGATTPLSKATEKYEHLRDIAQYRGKGRPTDSQLQAEFDAYQNMQASPDGFYDNVKTWVHNVSGRAFKEFKDQRLSDTDYANSPRFPSDLGYLKQQMEQAKGHFLAVNNKNAADSRASKLALKKPEKESTPEPPHPNFHTGGGSGGGSGRISQEGDRAKALQEKVESLSQAYRLWGNQSDLVALKDEVLFGGLSALGGKAKGVEQALSGLTKAQQEHINSLTGEKKQVAELLALQDLLQKKKAADDSKKKDQENTDRWTQGVREAMREARPELSGKDKISYERFGYTYAQLKDPKAIKAVDEIDAKQFAQQMSELQQKLDDNFREAMEKSAERRNEELANSNAELKKHLEDRKNLLQGLVDEGDALAVKAQGNKKTSAIFEFLQSNAGALSSGMDQSQIPSVLNAAAQQFGENYDLSKRVEATERLTDALAGARSEFNRINGSASEYADVLDKLGLDSKTLTQDQLQIVKALKSEETATNDLKRSLEQANRMAEAATRTVTENIQNIFEHGFKGSFRNLIVSTRKMIQSFLLEMAQSKLQGFLEGKFKDPKKPAAQGPSSVPRDSVADAIKDYMGSGGKNGALANNTTALNNLITTLNKLIAGLESRTQQNGPLTNDGMEELSWMNSAGGIAASSPSLGAGLDPNAIGPTMFAQMASFAQLFSPMFAPFLGSAIPLLKGFAGGGFATSGSPYVVGEAGPELFVPHHSGRIVPNSQLSSAGGGMHLHLHMPAGWNGDRRTAQQAGADAFNAYQKASRRHR